MGSKRPMQNLILEILNAQPSLRDSKTYLNSFAPRPNKSQHRSNLQHPHLSAQQPSTSHFPQPGPPPPPPKPFPPKRASRKADTALVEEILHPQLDNVAKQSDKGDNDPTDADSHQFAQPDMAVRSAPNSSLTQQRLDTPVSPETQAALAESLSSPPVQQHTALVKIQGPFTERQLQSIAEGMVYLKRLGLVSIIVIDSEEVAWRSSAFHFDPETGRPFDMEEVETERERQGLAPWLSSSERSMLSIAKKSSGRAARSEEALRKRMLNEVHRLAELLAEKGAPARPFSHPIMRVDAAAVAASNATNRPRIAGTMSGKGKGKVHPRFSWAEKVDAGPSKFNNARGGSEHGWFQRSPLVSDDDLASLRSALAHDMIPVIAPVALYDNPDFGGSPRSVCVRADDVLVGLAREMATKGKETERVVADTGQWPQDGVDMMPLRLMVINREGGIPSHARGGNPHLSINLASEYSHLTNSFIWNRTHPTALSNLGMVRDCLAYMPQTSSGVVVSHRSPRSLIANLITNKAAHSPSLPQRLLAGRKDVRHTPTIVRPGLDIFVIEDFSKVDRVKMTQLLEASFKRKLDADRYYERLEENCDFVIVTGDYQGAAIVTKEWAPGEDKAIVEPIAYLDKFAVLPSLQGSGAVDFLWGALRDEVHGLGLLDALNDNGGKGGFGRGRDLIWKSRADNPVNRWYFERSNGFVRIDTDRYQGMKCSQKVGWDPKWSMFWCDAEERIASMAGERRLGAEASAEDVWDYASLDGQEGQKVVERNGRQARMSAIRRSPSPPRSSRSGVRLESSPFIDEEEEDLLSQDRDAMGAAADEEERGDILKNIENASPFGKNLSELDPRPGGGAIQRLLPVVAPEEEGRLDRWARCMATIQSAWL